MKPKTKISLWAAVYSTIAIGAVVISATFCDGVTQPAEHYYWAVCEITGYGEQAWGPYDTYADAQDKGYELERIFREAYRAYAECHVEEQDVPFGD